MDIWFSYNLVGRYSPHGTSWAAVDRRHLESPETVDNVAQQVIAGE